MNNPKVSIITPSYNSISFIKSTIDSVKNQTYSNWEMIIVDDRSPDGSVDFIEELITGDKRIKLICLSDNVGAAMARNKGIELAKGRFIAFLDSDDLWEPNKLEVQLKYMLDKNLGFTYTNYSQFSDRFSSELNICAPMKVNYSQLLKANYIGCLTVVYYTRVNGKFYFPLTKKRHDYALWLSMLKKFDYAHNVGEYLAKYRVHNNSLSSNKKDAFQSYFHILHNIEKVNKIIALYYTIRFSLISLIKKKLPILYRLIIQRIDSSNSMGS